MRLCISLLALIVSAAASQSSWQSQPKTLVDVLNNDPDYSLLLPLLQRTRLIPTLNKLNGSTFFAPTNDAVKHHADKNPLWQSLLSETHALVPDNVQEQLRQQLLYHVLNYSFSDLPKDSSPQTLHTLHFPQLPSDSAPKEPPPLFPIPHGLLGKEPQRLRLASRDGSHWLGVDESGNGGAKLVKGSVEAVNGIVYGVTEVLEPPADLATVVGGLKSLSYFQKVLTPEIKQFLASTSELTVFMPLDSAWEALDPLERLYLESAFAADDLRRILDMHVVSQSGVKWSDLFESSTKMTTRYGSTLEVTVSDKGTTISGTELVQRDIYASNGVLHLVSSLLVPPGALQLTPEKYLLALGCTTFVSLLHSVNLGHLINNTDNQYTILALPDNVLSFSIYGLPASGSPDLKRVLQYHFLPGLWKPSKVMKKTLLKTELREPGLDDDRQVIYVDVNDAEENEEKVQHIEFGGAGVIGDHVEIDNTIIYSISRPLDPPVDPLQTALPSLDLSSFLAAVFSTSLADVIKKMPRTTFLIPQNDAFKHLGSLVSDHLLAASSKQDLENVILHHIIDDVEYAKSLTDGDQRTFATLEGSDLQLERSQDNTFVTISASGGWAGMKSALYPRNMLTDTGVIHEVSDLMIPRSVELNIGKLMKAGKATTMMNVIVKAGFEWVLDGSSPPEGSEWADRGLAKSTWTLLCPTDDAFKKHNLTRLLEDPDALRAIVSQHLIPISPPLSSGSISIMDILNSNRPLPLDRLGTYRTLLTSAYGNIVFKEMEDKSAEYMVGIKNARGTDGKADWARVLSWGRTTTGTGTGGVVQIDRLLVPYHPPWWIEYGPPSFVGVVGVVLICLFFYGVRIIWNRDSTEATYEPVGGFGRAFDDS